jgi:hypothetical protein
MVTSTFDCSRTCRMRCASPDVVIEPSTSDTSYGPGRTVLDASRKCEIRTALATAASSSSQSSRVSWQPSHEANFQTASVGGGIYSSRTASSAWAWA